MDNQPWNSAQLADWKRFWESDLGQDYLLKLERTKQLVFANIINNANATQDSIMNLAGRAAGIDAVIQDIRAGIAAATEKAKEDKPKKKK